METIISVVSTVLLRRTGYSGTRLITTSKAWRAPVLIALIDDVPHHAGQGLR